MNKQNLLEELNLLLDAGEPLLTLFPKRYQTNWPLELPNNISPAMEWYADSVSWRAWDREHYQNSRKHLTPSYLAVLVERKKRGLLGWRAIGVLP